MAISIEELKSMVREDFEEQKVIYLEHACKTLKIPYYNKKTHIKKAEMIDRIIAALNGDEMPEQEQVTKNESNIVVFENSNYNVVDDNNNETEETEPVKDEEQSTIDEVECENGDICENETVDENSNIKTIKVEKVKVEQKEPGPWEKRDVSNVINESEIGTLMCFIDCNGKIRTAALLNRSDKRKEVKLQTEFGMEFIVPYDNVLWVRKSGRWPRGIYNLLKNGGEIIVYEED